MQPQRTEANPEAAQVALDLERADLKPVASGHRSRELDWCRTHAEVLRRFAGQWIVLEGEEIVAHGDDPLQVVAEARAKAIPVPYIFYVDDSDTNVVKMGL